MTEPFNRIPHLIRTDYYGKKLGPLLEDLYRFYESNRQNRYGDDGVMPYGYLGKIQGMQGLRCVFSRRIADKYPPDLERMAKDVEYLLSFLPRASHEIENSNAS
jgi:hypothetical protein